MTGRGINSTPYGAGTRISLREWFHHDEWDDLKRVAKVNKCTIHELFMVALHEGIENARDRARDGTTNTT